MTRDEAISEMKKGKKVRHESFSDYEWMTMKDGKIHLEDGVICSPDEFWRWRQLPSWNNYYSLFKQ